MEVLARTASTGAWGKRDLLWDVACPPDYRANRILWAVANHPVALAKLNQTRMCRPHFTPPFSAVIQDDVGQVGGLAHPHERQDQDAQGRHGRLPAGQSLKSAQAILLVNLFFSCNALHSRLVFRWNGKNKMLRSPRF